MTTDRELAQKDIQAALEALGRGDLDEARRLAEHAASLAPDWETPLLILAVRSEPHRHLALIQKALQVNPDSKTARQALMWELERRAVGAPFAEVEPPAEPEIPLVGLMRDSSSDASAVQPAPQPPLQKKRPSRETKPAPARTKEQKVRTLALEPWQPDDRTPSAFSSPLPARPVAPPAAEPPHPSSPGEKRTPPSFALFRGEFLVPIGLALLAVIVLLSIQFQPQVREFVARLLAGRTPVPTPQCVQPVLAVGGTRWPIETIARKPDGSLSIPDQSGQAWWVEGTSVHYVFELNPDPQGVASLANITLGDSLTITWADCTRVSYVVTTLGTGAPIYASLFDQSRAGITVLIPDPSGGAALLLDGMTPEALGAASPVPTGTPGGGTLISPEPTQGNVLQTELPLATPVPNSVQAEISLDEVTSSPDQTTITVSISINNVGQVAVTLTAADVSLTPENGSPLLPDSIEPSPPIKISPGTTQTVILVFPRPSTVEATFKVFTEEFILDGY
jgi:hypothetical protein